MTRPSLLIFGLGFTGLRFARAARLLGWRVCGTVTSADKADHIGKLGIPAQVFGGTSVTDTLAQEVRGATHIISTIPPRRAWHAADTQSPDPVLSCFSEQALTQGTLWLAYLSTTGVYGDHQGGWVDETTSAQGGVSAVRRKADEDWRTIASSHIFRLPGIYGPGRSAIERAQRGKMSRVDKPGQVVSRVHVDDIVQTLLASAHNPAPGEIYNVADDEPTASHAVEEYACTLLGITPPPLVSFEDANLSGRGREFYTQCRRVKNDKIKSSLGIRLIYPDYKKGLDGCFAEIAR